MGSAAIKLSLNDAAFVSGLRNATSRFDDSAGKMMGMASKMGAVFTAVAGGGLSLLVSRSLDAGDALAKTADKLGLTTEALAGLRYAGEQTGVAVNTMDMATQRFVRRLAEAAQGTGEAKSAIKELGLDAQKLAAMPVDQAMAEVAGAMAQVKSQSDRVRLSFKLFDSEGVALVNTLALGKDGMAAAAQEARDLGLALDRTDTAKMEQAKNAMLAMQSAIQGVVNKLTIALAPWITAVSEQFVAFAKSANVSSESIISGLGDIVKELGYVADVIVVTSFGWKKLELAFNIAKANILDGFGELDKKIQETLDIKPESGSFFGDVFNNLLKSLPIVGDAFESEMGVKNVDLAKKSNDAWADVAQTFAEMDDKIKAGLPSDKITAFFDDAQKRAQKLAAEVARIKAPDQSAGTGTPGTTVAADKQQQQLAALAIERARAESLGRIAIKREELDRLRQLGQISGQDAIEQEKRLADQIMQIEIKAAKDHARLVKDKPVEYQKAMDKIESIQRKHDLTMKKMQTKTALEQKKFYDKMFAPVTNAFQKSINGMIQGTLSFRKAMKQMGQSIVLEFANMGVKMLVDWVKTEALKTAATEGGILARLGFEEGGAAASLLISAGTAVKQIMMKAWDVMAGVYSALASIPVIGPFIAPAAAAGAFAVVAGYASNIASASGGYDIPAGVNPMTQLHQQEMVLPAHIANPLRDMIAGGGQAAGGNTTIVVQAMDARSFKQYLTRNASSLPPALKKLKRNFSA